MKVTEYNSLDDLEELRPGWDDLLSRTERATFFQSLDWLKVHWRHVGSRRRLCVLALREGGELRGVLPLAVAVETTSIGNLRVLTNPGDGWPSFYGVVGEDVPTLLAAALSHLQRDCRERFDVIALRALRGGIDQPLEDADRFPAGMLMDDVPVVAASPVPLLGLTGDWPSYWESRRAQQNRRRNVERCERRLAEQGEIRFQRYRPRGAQCGDAEPCWPLFETCVELSRRSWQAGLVSGNTMCHAEVVEFLRDAHHVAAVAGALDVSLLSLHDRPIAFVYGYHFQGYVDLVRIGFDPEYAKLAPGNVLWTRLIADSFARGDRWLDFGPTCLDYKQFWATQVEPQIFVTRYAPTAKGLLLRAAHGLRRLRRGRSLDTNQFYKDEVAQHQTLEAARNDGGGATLERDAAGMASNQA